MKESELSAEQAWRILDLTFYFFRLTRLLDCLGLWARKSDGLIKNIIGSRNPQLFCYLNKKYVVIANINHGLLLCHL